jgi:hypothetical protein
MRQKVIIGTFCILVLNAGFNYLFLNNLKLCLFVLKSDFPENISECYVMANSFDYVNHFVAKMNKPLHITECKDSKDCEKTINTSGGTIFEILPVKVFGLEKVKTFTYCGIKCGNEKEYIVLSVFSIPLKRILIKVVNY